MIMCVLLCYPVSIRMSQLQSTGRPISSLRITLSLRKILRIAYISFYSIPRIILS